MSSSVASDRRHRLSPLSPVPVDGALTPEQWSILAAIADAVVPSFSTQASNRLLQHPLRRDVYEASCARLERDVVDPDAHTLVTAYLAEKATAQKEFKDAIDRLVSVYLPADARQQLGFILSALNTRAGSLLLTGYATPLDCLPVPTRELILQQWGKSSIPLFRQLHQTFTRLPILLWTRTSSTLGRLISYPRVPVHHKPPTTFYPFTFLQIPPEPSDGAAEELEADVVIVGSGCGGAVAAKTLAEAGMKVVVVDKGYYWPPEHLPMSEEEGLNHLFASGGALQTDDTSCAILAGNTWGGGGTVNWSASLQTQGYVRREWSQKFGLTYFTSSEFQSDLDAVCERMGVGVTAVKHNKTNQVLLDGAHKLGWTAKVVPQNTGGEAHYCGYCTLGCGSCGKKGPTETFLPDAGKAGAVFIEGFDVESVIFSPDLVNKERIVTGIKGTWTSRDTHGGLSGPDRTHRSIFIRAPKVILSAGTLATPNLLRRSGLTNPHIGRHLHLHPVSWIGAVWDSDIRPWEGGILTAVVNEFENLDGEGYGVKLEAMTMLPSLFLPIFTWKGALEWKEFVTKMKRMTGYISLARDRYGGRVYPDPKDGRTRVRYTASAYDKNHILEGLVRLAELLYVEGAREIHTAIPSLEPFIRPLPDPETHVSVTNIAKPSINDSLFKAWTEKLRKTHLPTPDSPLGSAHQMGSCRMSVSPETGVVDHKGRVWGTQGLWICDASVFPSASGVNPMVTCMGISRGIARGIVEAEGGGDVKARL